MMQRLSHWAMVDDSGLGVVRLEGGGKSSGLAVPMMMLCVVEQMLVVDGGDKHELESVADGGDKHELESVVDWAIKEILKHVQVCCCMKLMWTLALN